MRVRVTIVLVEKQCVTYSEGFFAALGIQHTMRMRHIVIFCLAGSTVFLFPTLSHKGHDFRGGGGREVTEKSVFIFPTILSEIFFILRRNERDIIKNVYLASCKVLVILVRF
jgi:hypothetical protein